MGTFVAVRLDGREQSVTVRAEMMSDGADALWLLCGLRKIGIRQRQQCL